MFGGIVVVLGMSSGWLAFDIIVLALLIGWGVSAGISAYRRKHYATVLDEDAFREGMRKAQVIDLRQKDAFDKGHILGARSLPYIYLKQQYGELRPDLPVYLYDDGMQLSTQAVTFLAKKGYHKLYILKGGYADWHGKTKKAKYAD